jgi:hypothetical protein
VDEDDVVDLVVDDDDDDDELVDNDEAEVEVEDDSHLLWMTRLKKMRMKMKL